MSTTKYCLNMMMKTFYIQWSFIARTWFSQNATTRSMTKNCWSLFAVWNIDVLNWNVWIFQLRSSSIIWIWSTSWSSKNWSDDKLNELRSYLNITSRSYISQENRIWKSTCWSECQTLSQLKQIIIESYISIRYYYQKINLNCSQWKLIKKIIRKLIKIWLRSCSDLTQNLTQIQNLNQKLIKIRLKR